MRIEGVTIPPRVLRKLSWKHSVTEREVRQVFRNRPRFRYVERGDVLGEDLYAALGRTDSGRYLIAYFVHKKSRVALVVSCRDMNPKERRAYAKK